MSRPAIVERLFAHEVSMRASPSDVAQLLAYIEGLERDAARLDSLEALHSSSVFKLGDTWYSRLTCGQPHTRHATLRAAIDSADVARKGVTP